MRRRYDIVSRIFAHVIEKSNSDRCLFILRWLVADNTAIS